MSEKRDAVSWRLVALSLALTVALAIILLKIPPVRIAVAQVNGAVDAIAAATRAGTAFVFGYLGGGALPFDPKTPGSEFILAFNGLPIVLVMSVLTTLLFYWKILPLVVRGFSWALERTLGIGGAVGLSTAANIFVGNVEAPLFIRPYLARLTRAELFIVMTGGMAGIAGTVLVLYATILQSLIPDVAGHLIVASVLGAPAAILISALMVPETKKRKTKGELDEPELAGDQHHGRDHQRHHRRARASAQHRRHAARSGRAGASRQCDPERHSEHCRRAGDAAARARNSDGAGLLADGHSLERSGHRRLADGHQDRAQRIHRLYRIVETAGRVRSATARA